MNCKICYFQDTCGKDIKSPEVGGAGSLAFDCDEYTPPSLSPPDLCSSCGLPLTPESRLLSAIFDEDQNLCPNCSNYSSLPKCHCNKEATVHVCDVPLCSFHAAELYPESK